MTSRIYHRDFLSVLLPLETSSATFHFPAQVYAQPGRGVWSVRLDSSFLSPAPPSGVIVRLEHGGGYYSGPSSDILGLHPPGSSFHETSPAASPVLTLLERDLSRLSVRLENPLTGQTAVGVGGLLKLDIILAPMEEEDRFDLWVEAEGGPSFVHQLPVPIAHQPDKPWRVALKECLILNREPEAEPFVLSFVDAASGRTVSLNVDRADLREDNRIKAVARALEALGRRIGRELPSAAGDGKDNILKVSYSFSKQRAVLRTALTGTLILSSNFARFAALNGFEAADDGVSVRIPLSGETVDLPGLAGVNVGLSELTALTAQFVEASLISRGQLKFIKLLHLDPTAPQYWQCAAPSYVPVAPLDLHRLEFSLLDLNGNPAAAGLGGKKMYFLLSFDRTRCQ